MNTISDSNSSINIGKNLDASLIDNSLKNNCQFLFDCGNYQLFLFYAKYNRLTF